jgi:glycosyltransferase involved in cell wall biosynthesis
MWNPFEGVVACPTVNIAAVIPCLNEAETIAGVVAEARRVLPDVIVVDDGSDDRTASEAARAGAVVLRHERPRGKGATLAEGFKAARARRFEWAVALDGDGQHLPSDIPRFLAEAELTGAALVVGNRMGQAEQMPFLRRLTNRRLSAAISRLAGLSLPDTQCGFRLLDLAVWEGLTCRCAHFEFESELLLEVIRAGYGVAFVPIGTIYRAERSKIRPLRDGLRWLKWWLRVRREWDPSPVERAPCEGFQSNE